MKRRAQDCEGREELKEREWWEDFTILKEEKSIGERAVNSSVTKEDEH